MKRIPLEEAVPGLVLVKPVRNGAGVVVMAAGLMLDEQLIAHLKRMGMATVHVEGASGEEASKSPEDLERELNARFRKVEGDPELTRIHDAICRESKSSSELLP